MRKNTVITVIAVVLVVVLAAGLVTLIFVNRDNAKNKVAEVEYTPTFGADFKEKYPISALTLRDSMPVAPYDYADTTLFSGKQITKIDAPVGTVTAVDEKQYFTVFVVKASTVKAGGIYTDGEYSEFKVYLPKEELKSTTVDKWITIDVSNLHIFVGQDETLAFMKPDDPVRCCYASGKLNDFYYDLGKGGKLQAGQSIYYGIYTDTPVKLTGKKLSVLGDSISTFSGISNNATDANNTIGDNAIFYPKYEIDKASETWWSQTAKTTGMQLLVNNSWSGSRVLNNNGAAYQTRCTQLHDNTGADAGTNPDIIAVYIGINDFNAGTKCGTFGKLADIYNEKDGYITPKTFAEAYAIMIHKMISQYGNADVFVFNLPPNGTNKDTATLAEYNKQIKYIAEYFKCYIVDIGNIEGYVYANYTSDGLHPNEKGMDLITNLFNRTLKGVYMQKSK